MGEISFDSTGFVIYMVAELCECGKLVMQQTLLSTFHLTVWEGMFFISPAAFVFLALATASRLQEMTTDGTAQIVMGNEHLFVWSAVLGCAVNFAGYCVIKTCSSLTLRVVEGVRSMFVVYISANALGEHLTSTEIVGYAIQTVGVAVYQYSRRLVASGSPPLSAEKGKKEDVRL